MTSALYVCLRCREKSVDPAQGVEDRCHKCSSYKICYRCGSCQFTICPECVRKIAEAGPKPVPKKPRLIRGLDEEGP